MDTLACIIKQDAIILDYYAKKGLFTQDFSEVSKNYLESLKLRDMAKDSVLSNYGLTIDALVQKNEACNESLIASREKNVRWEIIYDNLNDTYKDLKLKFTKVKGQRNVLVVVLGAILTYVGIIVF